MIIININWRGKLLFSPFLPLSHFPCRALLASVSLYFQRMFTSSFKESREAEIILKDLSATALESLLDYLYTGVLLPQAEQAEQLFTAASRLQMAPALEIVSRYQTRKSSVTPWPAPPDLRCLQRGDREGSAGNSPTILPI